jgi:hypothetical protein
LVLPIFPVDLSSELVYMIVTHRLAFNKDVIRKTRQDDIALLKIENIILLTSNRNEYRSRIIIAVLNREKKYKSF